MSEVGNHVLRAEEAGSITTAKLSNSGQFAVGEKLVLEIAAALTAAVGRQCLFLSARNQVTKCIQSIVKCQTSVPLIESCLGRLYYGSSHVELSRCTLPTIPQYSMSIYSH